MKPLAEDTDANSERVLIQLWRDASPARKLAVMLDANQTARALAMAGLRQRHPTDGADLLRRRLADLWLGPELAKMAYGPFPSHESQSG
jgi:hypothetical protein